MGFLKFDNYYQSADMGSGADNHAPRNVVVPTTRDHNDGEYVSTIANSRLILAWEPTELAGGVVSGKFVTDFFDNEGDTNGNRYSMWHMRIRNLYLNYEYAGWGFRFGHDWDIFSPLQTPTLNTNGNMWFAGNAGFRHPQARVTRKWNLGENHGLTTAIAFSGGESEVGQDNGRPTVQGLMSYTYGGCDCGPITFGLSGAWGEEEDVAGGAQPADDDVVQHAVGAHLIVPLAPWATLKGEIQTGRNTGSWLMGGTFESTNYQEIHSTSGWAALTLTPCERFEMNLMYGQDDPHNRKLTAGTDVHRNVMMGGNILYTLENSLTFGLEYNRVDTSYGGSESYDSNIIWGTAMLKF
jgi:hypothetical protein